MYLKDVAKVIRSKNAGPFEITMDIIFKTNEEFHSVWDKGIVSKELVSKLYNVPIGKIITLECFEAANAIKITLPRPRPQGTVGETDMHAAQQHVPLMMIEV